MRRIGGGIAIGALLSLVRAPLGIDLLQWPAVEARTAYGYRTLALCIAAVALFAGRVRSLSSAWLVAVAFGYAVHGLLLANLWSPAGHVSLWIAGLFAGAIAFLLSFDRREPDAAPPESTAFFEMLGIAIASAGVAMSLEGAARHLRLLGAGLAQDDSLFGAVLLALIGLGAAAFGWVTRAKTARSLSVPVALAAAAAGGYVALRVITSTATSRGLDLYLRSYGLDSSRHGMLAYDALLAASCFVAPALLIGAALAAVRARETVFSVLIGAAIGLFLVPGLFGDDTTAVASDKVFFSAQLIPLALLVAMSGAVLASLSTSARGARARWTALVLSASPCALLFAVTVRPQFVLSPWLNRLIMPFLASDTPEGFVTVEPTRGGLNIATLDRRELTPSTESLAADVQRMTLAIEALPPARRVKGDLRMLLIGQLTPARSVVLQESGVSRIDRSAAWSQSMQAIETQLFGTVALPEGEILAPSEARRRIDRGDYDLIVIPPATGDAPSPASLGAPEKTVVVAWISLDEPLPRQSIGERVIFTANGLDDPCIGVTLHAYTEDTGLRTLAAGPPRVARLPLCRLMHRTFDRQCAGRAEAARRFLDAARGGPDEELTAGLASFYAEQVHSSPFETSAEQVELPVEALEHFEKSALARAPDVFERQLWEQLARLLVDKRWIEELYKYVEPLATKYAPWPLLDHALARADIESLEPESAVKRLTKLTELQPDHPEHWYYLGEALIEAKREREAAGSLRRALALQPDNTNIKRKLAITLVHVNDPEGKTLAEELLAANPDDDELLKLLGRTPEDETPPPENSGEH